MSKMLSKGTGGPCAGATLSAIGEIGRAPALHLMLNQHKELKAALDKKAEVREILESKPDLTRNDLNERVHTNAQLKDLYDSRPELKELLQQRAKLFEDEKKALEDQKADAEYKKLEAAFREKIGEA